MVFRHSRLSHVKTYESCVINFVCSVFIISLLSIKDKNVDARNVYNWCEKRLEYGLKRHRKTFQTVKFILNCRFWKWELDSSKSSVERLEFVMLFHVSVD
jgi:hypothetical protein